MFAGNWFDPWMLGWKKFQRVEKKGAVEKGLCYKRSGGFENEFS